MILYYGANSIVTEPKYNFGNPSNDYGVGFYLTPDKEMARLWASRYQPNGFLITYDLDIKDLNVLKLDDEGEEDVLTWVSILIRHRFSLDEWNRYKQNIDWLNKTFGIDVENVDVITGYRADDSYFNYSRDFVANELSLEMLQNAMKLGKLGIQIMLKSKKAFTKIKYKSHEIVQHSNEYETFRLKTLQEYHDLKDSDNINNTFIRDIIRKYSK